MTITFNQKNYIALLERDEIAPKVIETEAEYQQFLAVAERLIFKRQDRTTEETTLLKLLVKLIKDYEEEVFDLENWSKTSPHELLQFEDASIIIFWRHKQNIVGGDRCKAILPKLLHERWP